MTRSVSHQWEPIRDYETDPSTYAKPELTSLAEVWKEQRAELSDSAGMAIFMERLRREWAIETGLLERIYTLDRGVTQMLIERGIDAAHVSDAGGSQDPDRVAAIIRDHEKAMEGIFAFVKGDRTLSTSYVKELHAQLTRNQETATAIDGRGMVVEIPLLRGAYKKRPNNPTRGNGTIHEYCPPEHVDSEMEHLIAMHLAHADVVSEVEAAWIHHRFTQIHPFQDGNGRVARCLATLVFLKPNVFLSSSGTRRTSEDDISKRSRARTAVISDRWSESLQLRRCA